MASASPPDLETEENRIDNDMEKSPFNSSVEDGNDSDFGDDEEDLEEDELAGSDIEDNIDEDGGAGRRKRKKKTKYVDPTKRRRIRRILREDELQSKTLEAQQEERERLKRLELQKSLKTESAVAEQNRHLQTMVVVASEKARAKAVSPVTVSAGSGTSISRSGSPLVVDFREQKKNEQTQVIVIDSDEEVTASSESHSQAVQIISSDSEPEGLGEVAYSDDEQSDPDYDNSGAHTEDILNCRDLHGRVLVNIGHPANEEDIFLAPIIARSVKAHQIGGIRFLFDNLVESLHRYTVSQGFGCILAHAMGLGKTLQLIAFIDVFLCHTAASRVLCIVPINTIQNWLAEFNMWLPGKPEVASPGENGAEEDGAENFKYRHFNVYLLNDNQKTMLSRAKIIGEWKQKGGVLLMGYEMYRLLALARPSMSSSKMMPVKKKKLSNQTDRLGQEPEVIDLDEEEKNMDLMMGIQRAICNPGPDLVICDEGHRIKNNSANISQALKKIQTRRRVVLTGYPLQNNLIEYWCMVDFVRPNFLGTKHEFSNMFERPILNGQCTDSTPKDVKLMRYRSHVLHSLLEGFVQRRSQSVLLECLPHKQEHILCVKLSPIQYQLYNKFIDVLMEAVGHLNPIKGFHMCTKIWNHPDVLYQCLEAKKQGKRNESPLTILDGDMDGLELPTVRQVSQGKPQVLPLYQPPSVLELPAMAQVAQGRPQIQLNQPSVLSPQLNVGQPSAELRSMALLNEYDWASEIMSKYQPSIVEQGGKMVLLMEIIEESLRSGEKILVFSQSLSTLSVIEEFLVKRPVPYLGGRLTGVGLPVQGTNWMKNTTYFRLDGNTPAQERERLINLFNSSTSEAVLFLLSTRASCLGINLIGASRVVVFDVSWNPCHDVQAICRVYRYGQEKPCHIYRMLSMGTMEKKMYDRQVAKQGMSDRVVDELNPEANFTKQEIVTLICDEDPDTPSDDLQAAASQFSDPVLKRICQRCSQWMTKVPFKHESLLGDKKEQKLTKAEKKEAKRGYEMEKRMAVHGGRYYPSMAARAQASYRTQGQAGIPLPRTAVGPPLPNVQPTATVTPNRLQPLLPSVAPIPSLHIPMASLIHTGIGVQPGYTPAPTNTTNAIPGVLSMTGEAPRSSSSSSVVRIDLTSATEKQLPLAASSLPSVLYFDSIGRSLLTNTALKMMPNSTVQNLQETLQRQQQRALQMRVQSILAGQVTSGSVAPQPSVESPLTAGLLVNQNGGLGSSTQAGGLSVVNPNSPLTIKGVHLPGNVSPLLKPAPASCQEPGVAQQDNGLGRVQEVSENLIGSDDWGINDSAQNQTGVPAERQLDLSGSTGSRTGLTYIKDNVSEGVCADENSLDENQPICSVVSPQSNALREDSAMCPGSASLGQGASAIENKPNFSSCADPVQGELVVESSPELSSAIGSPQIDLAVESRRLMEGLVRVQTPVVEAVTPSTNPANF